MAYSRLVLRVMRWTEGNNTTLRYTNPARPRSGPLPMNDLDRISQSQDKTTFRRCDIVQRMSPLLATTATAAIQLPCKGQLCTSGGNPVAARCFWCLSEVVIRQALRQRTANGRKACSALRAC